MKKVSLLLLLCYMLSACADDPTERDSASAGSDSVSEKIITTPECAVAGRILVKFSSETADRLADRTTRAADGSLTRSGITDFDAVMETVAATSLRPLFHSDPRHVERERAAGLHRWYVMEFDDEQELEDVALRLAAVAEVSRVQYDQQIAKTWRDATPAASRSTATRADASLPFDDPLLADQWHYINRGDTELVSPSVAGADVNCEAAWRLTAGDPSIVVAVVDEGVMYSHEDLAANMWVNEAELNGSDGQDDDGNGYSDDIYGYNFVAKDGKLSWDNNVGRTGGDSGHGTHVAGTVAAVNNNGIGVSGVAGGSGVGDGVRIMACQIFDGRYNSSSNTIVNAIKYAADNGAHILQCSWGYDSRELSHKSWLAYYTAEKEAIDYFISYGGEGGPVSGGIVIFAAGNSGHNPPGPPSTYENVICVTAIAADFTPSTFSDYGAESDIAAPGGDSDYAQSAAGCILSTLTPRTSSSNYGYMEGTSMACPHVSGVAALGLSYAKKLGRQYTEKEFRQLMMKSCGDLDARIDDFIAANGEMKNYYYYYLSYNTRYPMSMNLTDYRKNMGAGYIDAYNLLLSIKGTPAIYIPQGEDVAIDLTKYMGGAAGAADRDVTVEIDAEDMERLGLTSVPVASKGVMTLNCPNVGTGTFRFTLSVGDNTLTGEVAVIVRAKVASNGGWL